MGNIKISEENVASNIHLIRGQKVMLDSDLASMYGVETKRLNEQVKRNIGRFPEDFMFQLTEKEFQNLKSQFATSSWGGKRKPPYVFTEHGVIMAASVLNSPVAIEASILVVRVFVKLRNVLEAHRELARKIEELEIKSQEQFAEHSEQLQLIFATIKQLIQQKNEPRNPIGFKIGKGK